MLHNVSRTAPAVAESNGVELSFDTFGEPTKPALLLIMGLGGPLNWWHPELCERLADAGFFVIRYDNRDVGRSTKFNGQGGTRRAVVRTYSRVGAKPPYTMSDMAGDALGLLDHLGIGQAHVTGVSMGGMIAQTLAIEHPQRLRTMTTIMLT